MIYKILLLILLVSCNQKNVTAKQQDIAKIQRNNKNNSLRVKKSQSSALISKKIIGAWTSGNSENADFEFKEKTVYYVEQSADYKYSLHGNQIAINYPDYVYKATITFKADTLIMVSKKYGKAKYRKFKG